MADLRASGEAASRDGGKRLLRGFIPPILYLLLSFIYNSRAWADPKHLYLGVGGDPQQTIWFLAWVPHAIANLQNPLLTDYLNYPAGANLTWQTSEPLTGLLTGPLNYFFGAVFAYNAAVTLAMALAGWSAYLALRRFVPSFAGALAGGTFYAFSPFMVGQSLGHLHMLWIASLPLFVLVLDDVLRQRKRWWINAVNGALLFVATAFISEEVLAIDALGLGIILAVILWQQRHQLEGHWQRLRSGLLPTLFWGGAIALAGCACLIITQELGPNKFHGRPEGYDIFVSDPLSFFFPDELQALSPAPALAVSQHFSGNSSEWGAYLGIPLLALIFWMAWRHRHDYRVVIAAAGGTVAALLSLGPRLHIRGHATPIPMPWWIFDHVPLLNKILPVRISYVVAMAAAFFIALAIRDLQLMSRLRARAGIAALLLAAAVTLWPAHGALASPVPQTSFFSGSDLHRYVRPGEPILVAPVPQGIPPSAMIWQVQSGFYFKQPGGYLYIPTPHNGVYPITQQLIAIAGGTAVAAPNPAQLVQERAALIAAGIHTVILGPSDNHESLAAFINLLAGSTSQRVDDVMIWHLGS